MSFEVTVTPTVYDVEVSVNPSVQPFDVEVITQQDLADLVDEAKQYAEDAEDSADSASASASSASASASASASSANSASASASSASGSASTATTQAGIATTQAAIATTQAGIATTKAQEASQSASDALASEQASAQSASDALASEQASAQSASDALASEQASALSEANALASEQSALSSANTATVQAGIATTQAGNALTSANNALNSANAAAASAASAAQVGTSTLLTGFSTGANSTILSTDTILGAFQKAQGQINARVSGTGASGQVGFWNGTSSQTGSTLFTIDTVNRSVSLTGASVVNILNITSTALSSALRFEENSVLKGFVQFVGSTFSVANRQNYLEIQGASGIAFRSSGEMARFMNNNFLINTTTDAGFRLDVNGTARVQGALSVTTGADTTPLTISGYSITGLSAQSALSITGTWNTTGTPIAVDINITDTASGSLSNIFRVTLSTAVILSIGKNSSINFGSNAGSAFIAPSLPTTGAQTTNGQSITLGHNITTALGYGFWLTRNSGSRTATSGENGMFRFGETFAPTSGTGVYNSQLIATTINQTGGANGITRGLFVNPTLTAAADWRSIEWSNNTGWGLYGVGTALNYLNGNLLLGSTTSTGERLQVTGTARISATADAVPLTIAGYSLTGSNAQSALSITGTWNTTGTPSGIFMNITDTASNASSLLMQLQVGGGNRFRVAKSGQIDIGSSGIIRPIGADLTANPTGENLLIASSNVSTATGISLGALVFRSNTVGLSSGIYQHIYSNFNFFPTSGTAVGNSLVIGSIINQTGGANGITRGLFVNPTLTAAADWRSIEWSNNTGRGLWGTGTANNALAGATHIGSATNANASAILELTSTTRGLLLPRMTSAERDLIASPVAGLVVYNTTDNKISWYNGTAWANL
jgi:hypothetical protein